MPSQNRKIYLLSIVFIGDFNPSIIQPFLLRAKNLIIKEEEEEAENAVINVIHHELVRFVI
jgi:hypothetical protein